MSSILRGGRLAASRKDMVRFISSVQDDERISHATVLVNEAHVIALEKAGAITRPEARKLLSALRTLERKVPSREGVEDVHVLIEEYVTRRTGREVGGQLHLAKSRNDQVVTAIRMVLRDELLEISSLLLTLEEKLLRLAPRHTNTVFPGYTHMQPAQPITFAHYLTAICDAFLRDNERILQAYVRVDKSPLGAGALAGSSIKVNRILEARLLGFDGIVENTLDAIGSRDFVLDALNAFSIVASNLSRLAEDLIFYSSAEVGNLAIPDEFTSTSSIMPQKKNPDPLELIRAKAAKVVGDSSAALTMVHGLPSGYNLDFQELTGLLWDACDTLKPCLRLLTQIVPGLKPNKSLQQKTQLEYTAATEIANILVSNEGIPFRTAHRAVGHIVRVALQQGKTLRELGPKDWERALGNRMGKKTMDSIPEMLDLDQHVREYRTQGSPNPKQIAAMLANRKRRIQQLREERERRRSRVATNLLELHSLSRRLRS